VVYKATEPLYRAVIPNSMTRVGTYGRSVKRVGGTVADHPGRRATDGAAVGRGSRLDHRPAGVGCPLAAREEGATPVRASHPTLTAPPHQPRPPAEPT
jgi:hypothetical protein